jgi:hypothetical protein
MKRKMGNSSLLNRWDDSVINENVKLGNLSKISGGGGAT